MVIMIEAEGDTGMAARAPATQVENVVALPRRRRGQTHSGVTASGPDQRSSSWRSGQGDAGSFRARETGGASAQSSGAPAYSYSASVYRSDGGPGPSAQHSNQHVTQGRSGPPGEQERHNFADVQRGDTMFAGDRFPWELPSSGMSTSRMLGRTYSRGPSLLPGSVQTEYSETEAGRRAPGCIAPVLANHQQQQQQQQRLLGSPELPSALSSLVFPEDNLGFGSPRTRRAGGGSYAQRPAVLGSLNPMLHGRRTRGLFPVMGDAIAARPRWGPAPTAPSLDAISNLPPDQLDSWLADWAGVPSVRAAAGRRDASEEDNLAELELEMALHQQEQTRNHGRQDSGSSSSRRRLEPMAHHGSCLPVAYRLAVM